MDAFKNSYGLNNTHNNEDGHHTGSNNDTNNLHFINNSEQNGDADENDYEYDGDKVGRLSSTTHSGNGLLGGVLNSLPAALAPSTTNTPYEHSTSHHGTLPPPQQQLSPMPPKSSCMPFGTTTKKNNNERASSKRASVNSHQPSSLPPPFVMKVTAIASLGGVLFGYDMGVIAGALPQLKTAFDLTNNQEELVVSILYVGGGLGAAVGGTLCDVLGRRPAILLTDVGFMVGASVLFTAPHVASVCVGRVIVGFAVAVSGIADVSYLHEIAPTQWRGAIVSVNEACISLGFLLAFVVGIVLTPSPDDDNNDDGGGNTATPPRGWRYMFGIGGALALVQFIGMWSMPESPVWLREQGRHEESRAALRRIHGRDQVPVEDYEGGTSDHPNNSGGDDDDNDGDNDNEVESQMAHQLHIKSPMRDSRDAASGSKASYESISPLTIGGCADIAAPEGTGLRGLSKIQHQIRTFLFRCRTAWRSLIATLSKYRRQVWIALFLSVTQQLCGQTSVLNYAPTILEAVVQQDNAANNKDGNGADDTVSAYATLSIGIVKFIATVLVIWKIEVIGRRRLLLMGMGIIAFGLLLVAVAFSASSSYLQEKQEAGGVVVQSGSGFYFALPGVLLVVSGYSMSFGPLTWLLTSELFPTEIRGRALGASTIVTYLCAAMVTYSFLTAQSLMGTSVVFLLYMLITLCGMVFACVAIPDTGGKTLEVIDEDLSKMAWWRYTASSLSSSASSGRLSFSSSSRGGDTLSTSNSTGRIVEAELT